MSPKTLQGVHVRLPIDLVARIRLYAAAKDLAIQNVIAGAVRKHVPELQVMPPRQRTHRPAGAAT